MAKVVILSNTDGYYALAKKSLNSLRKDNILKDEGAAYLVTEMGYREFKRDLYNGNLFEGVRAASARITSTYLSRLSSAMCSFSPSA